MKRDRNGFVEIGYIYALVISALVFVTFTTMLSDTVEKETDRSVRVQLYEIGGKIEMNINNAVNFINSHPDSSVELNIRIPTTVGGRRYSIYVNDNVMSLNSTSTGISVKFYLIGSNVDVFSINTLTDNIEPLLSSYGSINLKYCEVLNNTVIRLSTK